MSALHRCGCAASMWVRCIVAARNGELRAVDSRVGSNCVNCRFTMEMAKHASQLSQQPCGYQICEYFIDCDNQLRYLQIP